MHMNGFNVIEYFYYKGDEKVSFLLKYVMEPTLVNEIDNSEFEAQESDFSEFTDKLIAVGRNNGLSFK
jgi:hypothetical protein